MDVDIAAFLRSERLPATYRQQVDAHWTGLADQILAWRRAAAAPIVVGICGSQGSGKSTLARLLALLIAVDGRFRAEALSLDDIYLPRADRLRLAADIHPLLATRGVPGTHDVELGIGTIDALTSDGAGTSVPLPAFDKATDDRLPPPRWQWVDAPADIVLFEGWCVGAIAQPPEALTIPVNALERVDDADGRWRRHVNDQLAGPYRALFGRLDHLVYLKAPDFAAVRRWRGTQEAKLRSAAAPDPTSPHSGIMDDAGLDRFLLFYERITRHLFATMPDHADITYLLDDDQRVAERIAIAPFPTRPTDATL
jgi:D-glycerate 3-kinase